MTPRKTTPAKKTAATTRRSPRAARPAAAVETPKPDIIEAVVIGGDKADEAPVEMVKLFELDGVAYEIPRNPSAALVLSYMMDATKLGPADANIRMAVALLGNEQLQALAASPAVQPVHLEKIFANIGVVFFNSENYAKIMGAADPS